MRQLGMLCLLLAVFVACAPTAEEPAIGDVVGVVQNVPVTTPTAVVLPSPAATFTPEPEPQRPVLSTVMSEEVEGWYVHHNETYGYQISFPPVADVWLYGDVCFFGQLYESGYLLITAVDTPLPAACRSPALDVSVAGEAEAIRLAGELVMAEVWEGSRFYVQLPNGLQVEYGLWAEVDPDVVDAQAALVVMADMVDSLRFETGDVLQTVMPTALPPVCLSDAPSVAVEPLGLLRVRYELEGQLWEWREETATAVPVEAADAGDGRWQWTVQQPDEYTFELWGSYDGGEAQKLYSSSIAAYADQYPELMRAELKFGWVGDSSLLYVYLVPEFGALGGLLMWPIELIDTETGQTWTALPGDVAWAHAFTADGRWLIALLDTGVQLIDPLTGQVEHDIQLEMVKPYHQTVNFTPDGAQLYVYTAEGIAFIDVADGTLTTVPLTYAPIGLGHHTLFPSIHWLGEAGQFYTFTSNDDVWDKAATFTIWRADVASGESTAVNTFAGFYMSVMFSPDGRWVVFWPQSMDNRRRLHIADVVTGEQGVYDELRLLEFIGWSPDNTQFVYKPFKSTAEATGLIVGNICQPPRPLGVETIVAYTVQWVDSQRLLVLDGRDDTGSSMPRPLRLVTLDGQSTPIVTLVGDQPSFDFYWEVVE